MMRYLRYFLFALILLIGGGFIYFFFFFKYPSLGNVRNFKVIELADQTLKVELEAGLYNPNILSFSAKDLDALFGLDGIQLARIQQANQFTILANDTTYIPLSINLDLNQLQQSYPEIAQKSQAEANFTVNVNWLIAMSSLPIYFKKNVAIDLSEIKNHLGSNSLASNLFSIQDIQVRPQLTQTEIDLNIHLENPYNFDYTIQNLEMDLSLGEKATKVGSWTFQESHLVQAQSAKKFPLNFKISNARLMLSGLSSRRDIQLFMKGNCQVVIGGVIFPLPITYRWDVPLL